MWLLDRGDNQPSASLIGRGRDIDDFEYTLEWDQETWRYSYKGIKWEIELSENRKAILDHMKYLLSEGKEEVMPKDVYLRMGFKANQKEAKNISKTIAKTNKIRNEIIHRTISSLIFFQFISFFQYILVQFVYNHEFPSAQTFYH